MPTVISKTIQEFNGRRYYLCGKYFQNKGERLHRAVWEHYNGEISEGYHIHHKDENTSNNRLSNLECVTVKEHFSERHVFDPPVASPADYRKAARWHKSLEGHRWHKEHYEKNIRPTMDRRVPAKCVECGKDYLVSAARVAQGKFCGGTCKARALRKRRGPMPRGSRWSHYV